MTKNAAYMPRLVVMVNTMTASIAQKDSCANSALPLLTKPHCLESFCGESVSPAEHASSDLCSTFIVSPIMFLLFSQSHGAVFPIALSIGGANLLPICLGPSLSNHTYLIPIALMVFTLVRRPFNYRPHPVSITHAPRK